MNAIQPIPPTIQQIKQMQMDFYEASQPIIKALCDIESVTFHKIFIDTNGNIRKEENYSPQNQKYRQQLLEHLKFLKKKIFSDLYKQE